MQGDNARTIDDQVVPDEEAKLLLAYLYGGNNQQGSLSEKTAGTLGETGNQIFFRIKKEGRGKCPGDIKKKSM